MATEKTNDLNYDWEEYYYHEVDRSFHRNLTPYQDCDLNGELFVCAEKLKPNIMLCLFVPYGPLSENSLQWGTWYYEDLPTNTEFPYQRLFCDVYKTSEKKYRMKQNMYWRPNGVIRIPRILHLHEKLGRVPWVFFPFFGVIALSILLLA